MTMSADELKNLRTEFAQLGQKLQALDAEELKQVCGGRLSREDLDKMLGDVEPIEGGGSFEVKITEE